MSVLSMFVGFLSICVTLDLYFWCIAIAIHVKLLPATMIKQIKHTCKAVVVHVPVIAMHLSAVLEGSL